MAHMHAGLCTARRRGVLRKRTELVNFFQVCGHTVSYTARDADTRPTHGSVGDGYGKGTRVERVGSLERSVGGWRRTLPLGLVVPSPPSGAGSRWTSGLAAHAPAGVSPAPGAAGGLRGRTHGGTG